MKLHPIFKSRTENFRINTDLAVLKKLLNDENKKFHFKWQSENSFIISLNFSVGSNLIFDTNYPNTKSDIIYYGDLLKMKDSKTEIILKTKRKLFLLFLMIALPILLTIIQIFIDVEFPIFMIALFLFPVAIVVLLNFIKSEEDRLLKLFIEFLNHRLNS